MAELLPCPFCGGKASFFTKADVARGTTRGWEFGIYCTNCSVTTPKTNYVLEIQLGNLGEITEIIDEREKAITAWNTRTESEGDKE